MINAMKYVIFEDTRFPGLYPLTFLRASFDVKHGALSIKEKIESLLPESSDIILFVREDLKNFTVRFNGNKVNVYPDDETIFLNGRVVFTQRMMNWIIKDMRPDTRLNIDDTTVASRIKADTLKKISGNISYPVADSFFDDLRLINTEQNKFANLLDVINYPWDLLRNLDVNLGLDIAYLIENSSGKNRNTEVSQDKDNFVSATARVYPAVILDTANGEIYVDDDAVIEPFCYIKGPVYIGKGAVVKAGSRLYGPVSVGWGSKVSGEISGSVFHSLVNKQHDGFIGNTYACPFVNFGADTVTSNLKNNYSKIKIEQEGSRLDTGMQFLGSIVGDHTKFGINTMLNTGTVSGIFANVAGGGFPGKNISSFSWNIIGKDSEKYRLDELLATARFVMKRRNLDLCNEYELLIRKVYDNL